MLKNDGRNCKMQVKGVRGMDIIRLIKEDMREQQYLLQVYKQGLEKLPEGRLHYRMMDGKVRYFTMNLTTKKEVYLKKKEQKKVYQLKYRRVLEEAIKTIEQNLKVQEIFLKKYKEYDPAACQSRLGKAYQDAPEVLHKMGGKRKKYESYQNPYRKEELIHESSFGMVFRSKSEVLIAELLYKAGIPFYYESRLVLYDEWGEKHFYYPDFTIALPDGRVVYWEHFGRMDSSDYREKNYKKLSV
jgi:hypothetical protein